MQDIIQKDLLVKENIIARISPGDAVRFAATCRAVADHTRIFDAAIAFALTRPTATSEEDSEPMNGMDVQSWKCVWEACAQSVAASRLEPSLWAYSHNVLQEGYRIYGEMLLWYRFNGFKLISTLLEHACPDESSDIQLIVEMHKSKAKEVPYAWVPSGVYAVLMVDVVAIESRGGPCPHSHEDGLAMALLSDGQFAVFAWSWNGDDCSPHDGLKAIVCIANTIPALFELLRTTPIVKYKHTRFWDCHWKMAGDGKLTLSSCRDILGDILVFAENFENFPYNCFGLLWNETDDERVGRLSNVFAKCSTRPVPTQPSSHIPEFTLEPVIQSIEHEEPPALRDTELVQEQAELDLVEGVETLGPSWSNENQAQPSNKVYKVRFHSPKRDGKLFRKMLLEDKEFRPLRKSLKAAGFKCELKNGTIVLVRPDQYLETRAALHSHDLKQYNVVIAESEEYLMEEVLSRLAYKSRPREKKDDRQELDLYSFCAAKMKTKRTFLVDAPSLNPTLRSSNSVVQSTTEAVRSASSNGYLTHARGQNPRRYMHADD